MLERRVLEWVKPILPPKSLMLCGLSGGADSVAMTRVLCSLREELDMGGIACAHYNHGLRGGAADADQHFCEELCRKLGILLYIGRAESQNSGGSGGEAEYRRLRYDFLTKTASLHDLSYIATAHTSDDNAETMLLNLIRGAGLGGLTGIPVKRPAGSVTVIRPLLPFTREDVLEYLKKIEQPFCDDATNHTDAYRRNRIRRHVIPELKKENPKLLQTLSRTSELLKSDSEYLEEQAKLAHISIAVSPDTVSAAGLLSLPVSLSTRVIRQMCSSVSGEPLGLSSRHIEAVLALCDSTPSATANLPLGLLARRVYDNLRIEKTADELTFKPVKIDFNQTVLLEGTGLEACWTEKPKKVNNLVYSFLLSSDTIIGGLTIRPRLEGDSIRLSGRGHSKTLRRMFIDKKIPKHKRRGIPVLADETGVVAVGGFGVDERCAPKEKATSFQIYREEPQGYDS